MIPRKTRIAILILCITFIILLILGTLGFLFLKTDIFTSKEKLFAKYLVQNIETINILNMQDNLNVENILDTNKYQTNIDANIQYTENIGTSDENRRNPINDVGIKIYSNTDKENNYDYKDIAITNKDENLVRLEYIQENENKGIRLDGIQQFVVSNNDEQGEDTQELNILNLENMLQQLNMKSIFSFSEEEKQTIINNYLAIIQQNIQSNRYNKQSNSLITVNNKDVQANAYSITLKGEELNNIYIKILEQVSKDEIILSKIDALESQIKENDTEYENESIRENFIDGINETIQEIQEQDIIDEDVKITVYESKGKTVRTVIEKATNKIMIDIYNDSSIKIDNIILGDSVNEQYIKIEKNNDQTQSNISVEYQKIKDNENTTNINLIYKKEIKNDNEIAKATELHISNEKYEAIFNIENNIKIVEEFENKTTLEENNVNLNNLSEEQQEIIKGILDENIQTQLENLYSVVTLDDYITMIKNLSVIGQNEIQMPSEDEITDISKSRFNSQFEFFASENLTKDNVEQLIQVIENNLEDMKVVLKTGEVEDLDIELLKSEEQDSREYLENISQILIYIKQNTENQDKQEEFSEFLEMNNTSKYNISIEYDDNGLVNMIKIEIVEE